MKYVLCKGELLSFEASGAIEAVTITTGQAWVTISGDTRDYCLGEGDRLQVAKGQRLIVQALQQSTVAVTCRESTGDVRITMAWSRQSPA